MLDMITAMIVAFCIGAATVAGVWLHVLHKSNTPTEKEAYEAYVFIYGKVRTQKEKDAAIAKALLWYHAWDTALFNPNKTNL